MDKAVARVTFASEKPSMLTRAVRVTLAQLVCHKMKYFLKTFPYIDLTFNTDEER